MSTVNFGNVRKAFHGETPIRQIYSQNQLVWPMRDFPTQLQQVGGGVVNHMEFHVGERWRWKGISGATGARLFISTDAGFVANNAPSLPCAIDNAGDQYFSVSPTPDGLVMDPTYFNEQPGSAWFISSRVFYVTFNKALPAGYGWYMGIEQLPGSGNDIWDGYEPAHIGGEILP